MRNSNENEYFLPFHLKTYWESYYKNSDLNLYSDWYFDLISYQSNLFNLNKFEKTCEIVVLGVGNSKIIEYLVNNKFHHITLVDFSNTLIENLKMKYENKEECKEWDFICEDVTKLTKEGLVPEKFYDIVIDKGCIDCILSEPNQLICEENLLNSLKEINKIMSEYSSFYFISTSKPDKMISHITSVFNAKIEIEEINLNENGEEYLKEFNEEDNIYHLYSIKKEGK